MNSVWISILLVVPLLVSVCAKTTLPATNSSRKKRGVKCMGCGKEEEDEPMPENAGGEDEMDEVGEDEMDEGGEAEMDEGGRQKRKKFQD